MLADLIREFCKENNYEVYENYPKRETIIIGGEVVQDETYMTIGIILKHDGLGMLEVLTQLADYIIEKGLLEQVFDELEGATPEGLDAERYVVCFPAIQDYQPPQP